MKNIALLLAFIFTVMNVSAQTEREIQAGVLNLKQQSAAPSSPSSGSYKSYIRDGKMRIKSSAGVESTVGTGGGDSGVNLLANEGFEDGISTGWTSSGGTFSSESYANATEKEIKYAKFIATTSGQYFESSAYATPDSVRGGCVAYFDYYTTDSASWKLQVIDGSGNTLKEQSLGPKDWQRGLAPFPCPSVGTTVKMRAISLAAGTIYGDRAYLGKENRTVSMNQAAMAGESYFAGTASCLWTRTSTTLGAMTSVAACPGPTVADSSIGSWQTTDADLPIQTINNLPAGKYKATFIFNNYPSVAATTSWGMTDGTTTCASETSGGGTATNETTVVSCIYNYSSSGNRSFQILGRSSTGQINIENRAGTGYAVSTKFQLEYFPNGEQTAFVPDAQGWFIDANIGGSGNSSMGTANVASYTEIVDSTLDMVLNTGSATAKIPCSSTNSSSGLTCSAGSEGIGAVFSIPQTGYYEACAAFSWAGDAASSSNVGATFQIVETTGSTQTIIQEGKSRIEGRVGATSAFYPFNLCGVFYFSSVGEKTLRLMYEQLISGTVNSSQLLTDRAAAQGQRDIRFTVRPMSTIADRPYLTSEQVLIPGTTRTRKFAVRSSSTCSSSPCSTSVLGNTVAASSTTRSTTGTYAQAIGSGLCSSTPFCSGGIMAFVSNSNKCNIAPSSATNVNIVCTNSAGSLADEGFHFECTCEY